MGRPWDVSGTSVGRRLLACCFLDFFWPFGRFDLVGRDVVVVVAAVVAAAAAAAAPDDDDDGDDDDERHLETEKNELWNGGRRKVVLDQLAPVN